MQPHVVVVVLNWNGLEDTRACLRSLDAVHYSNMRVLVVDNGSSDGSEAALRAERPQLQLLQTGSNLGFAGGNNRGIEWAMANGADYVLLLNNDTEVDPAFLDRMVELALANSEVGIVGASIEYFDRPGQLWAFGGGRFHLATGRVRHLVKPLPETQLPAKEMLRFYITGCTMLLTRALIERIGLLDRGYFHFCEDVDYCLRANAVGFRCAVAPAARIRHKVSATTRVGSAAFLYYNLRSRLRLIRRFGPVGAPSRLALALLWLRLWRPALRSGLAVAGWKGLRRALADFQAGYEGPAPAELNPGGGRSR